MFSVIVDFIVSQSSRQSCLIEGCMPTIWKTFSKFSFMVTILHSKFSSDRTIENGMDACRQLLASCGPLILKSHGQLASKLAM